MLTVNFFSFLYAGNFNNKILGKSKSKQGSTFERAENTRGRKDRYQVFRGRLKLRKIRLKRRRAASRYIRK